MTEVREMFGRTTGERSGEVRLPRPDPTLPSNFFSSSPSALAFVRAPLRVAGGWGA